LFCLRLPCLSAILASWRPHPAARSAYAGHVIRRGSARPGGGIWKASAGSVELPTTIVGHLAPDLDCLTAIWILVRFAGAADAALHFVPAGATLGQQPADADPHIIHVDTGGGRFDHHQRAAHDLCAAELVRCAIAPADAALERLVRQVCRIDNATAPSGEH